MMRLRADPRAGPNLAEVQGCAFYAARQPRGGLGLALRLAYSALCDARLLPKHSLLPCEAASGWPFKPALTSLENQQLEAA